MSTHEGKLKVTRTATGQESYWFWCPGCESHHRLVTRAGTAPEEVGGPVWTFNGKPDNPTFRPSLRVNGSLCLCGGKPGCDKEHPVPEHGFHRCHLYVTQGEIHFLGDCSHELKGQVKPLEPVR